MTHKKKQMSAVKKQMITVASCAGAFAVLACLYFFLLKPIVDKLNAPVTTSIEYLEDGNRILKNSNEEVLLTLLPGEEVGPGNTNRILITPQITREYIKSVEVKNPNDSFTLIHHLGQNYYYVEGAELVPINGETIASFFTNVGYLLSMERVAAKDIDDGNEILENLEQFGLGSKNNDDLYFIVTTTEDVWYKVIIGDKIPTTGGYYVMYEDKDGIRPAIYILDTMMEETILSDKYSIMLPIISEPVKQNEILYIDNFKFYKGYDLMLEIYSAPIPEGSEALVNWQMIYPSPYIISDRYSTLLYAFTNFTGDRVVHAFSAEEIIELFYSEEEDELDEKLADVLREFGFDEPSVRITFDFIAKNEYGEITNERNYYFVFSKPNERGNYYVLSLDFGSIIEISPEKLKFEGELQPFVEWDLLKFVNRGIFDQNINDVESMVVKIPGKEDAVFLFEGEGQDLKVTGNGKELIVNKIGNDDYFRGYYYAMLSIELLDYETDVYDDKEPLIQLIVKNRDGFVRDFEFYFVEGQTRRSFYRLNGSGNFYVLRDKVLKLLNDTELVLQNLPIAKDARE
ncbi:MAG: DUF4340 domain-containing protein [Oscillospiraceae bacterium]|nr:DUF4340 domain-containing protein [Oscillospiraceae bacterium]